MRRIFQSAFCVSVFAVIALGGCKERRVEVGEPTARVVSEKVGTGVRAAKGRIATIRYKLTSEDGKTMYLQDDSYRFEIGADAVIRAVDDTVNGMRVGGRRVVDCPPESHWGRGGYGGKIPPATTLRLELDLLDVQ